MAPGRAALTLSLLVGSVSVACYRPNIADGGFLCGSNGSCPEGFRCVSADNRCYRGDGGPFDVPVERTCTVPPPARLCDVQPSAGQACNPTCQTGCECGRCTVVNGVASCLETPGPKTLGQTCNVQGDDCGPGLGCVKEQCGTMLGRCYKFCATSTDCPGSLACSIPLEHQNAPTGFMVCDIAPQSCDPVGSTSGCPDPALGCYVDNSDETRCDCRGTIAPGDTCFFFSQCTPGHRCVGIAGTPTARCQQVCRIGQGDCPAPSACVPPSPGHTYGYCSF